MIGTWLVQRLGAPPRSELAAKAEQVFGGGMLALKPEAWKLLQEIFSIDYMGAAEFEFGTIPNCLKAMAQDHDKLQAFEMVVEAKYIEPNWERTRTARTKRGSPRKKQPVHPPVADRTVYVLCRSNDAEEVRARIRELATNKIRLKGGSCFPQALDPISEYDGRTQGWLELDNGFFFFVDKTMWRKTTALLTGNDPEAKPESTVAATP